MVDPDHKRDDQNTVKLAVIGAGAIGKKHADIAAELPGCRLVGICDADSAVQSLSDELGIKFYSDYEEMIASESPDGVIIATPTELHTPVGITCARHGVHLFVEKPIANTIEDGKQMIEACEKAGVVLIVGHYMRRWAGYRKLKELIDEGAIGNIVQVETNGSSNQGIDSVLVFIDRDDDPSTGYAIGGLGSDDLLEVSGWNNSISRHSMYTFLPGADKDDWNSFRSAGGATVAIGYRELEIQFGADSSRRPKILFAVSDNTGNFDFTDSIAVPNTDILEVVQTTISDDVTSIAGDVHFLRIELDSRNGGAHVSQINITKMGGSADMSNPNPSAKIIKIPVTMSFALIVLAGACLILGFVPYIGYYLSDFAIQGMNVNDYIGAILR